MIEVTGVSKTVKYSEQRLTNLKYENNKLEQYTRKFNGIIHTNTYFFLLTV